MLWGVSAVTNELTSRTFFGTLVFKKGTGFLYLKSFFLRILKGTCTL
jgi:hypothetical protein